MGRVSWNVLHIAESIYLCGHALLGSIRYGAFGATSLAFEHRDDPWHYNRPSVHCGFESKLGCIPGRCISRGLPLWWETYIVSAQMSNFLKSHYFFSEIFCGDFLFSLAGVFFVCYTRHMQLDNFWLIFIAVSIIIFLMIFTLIKIILRPWEIIKCKDNLL